MTDLALGLVYLGPGCNLFAAFTAAPRWQRSSRSVFSLLTECVFVKILQRGLLRSIPWFEPPLSVFFGGAATESSYDSMQRQSGTLGRHMRCSPAYRQSFSILRCSRPVYFLVPRVNTPRVSLCSAYWIFVIFSLPRIGESI